MATEVEYIVKHPFKYGGTQLRRGDNWEPTGGKWDDSIIKHHVEAVRVPQISVDKARVKHVKQPETN
jgi:hypothetical protein